jgi:hypothetical protein
VRRCDRDPERAIRGKPIEQFDRKRRQIHAVKGYELTVAA